MKKNYILALFLSFVIIAVTYFITTDSKSYLAKIKEVDANKSCSVTEINKEDDKYVIKAYMPITSVNELDEKINSTYKEVIDEFIKEVESLNLLDDGKKFSLSINFNNYEYEEYYSFLISYTCDFGGAHPDSNIKTINYNKKDKTFVNIDSLVANNKNIINVFSKYSYEKLSKDEELSEENNMLKNGTSAKKENFENFVFAKEGILLFFPNYSVSSYYLGDFEVLIPYDKVGL